MCPVRCHGIKCNGCLVGRHQERRALAEIVQDQRGEHDREPCEANGKFSEVTHVGVKRLAARYRQNHGAERDEGGPRLAKEQRDPVGVFAERQRVARRLEIVGVEDREAVPRGMPVPIENPSIDERIARIGDRAIHVRHEWPGHGDREQDEERCDSRVDFRHAARIIVVNG